MTAALDHITGCEVYWADNFDNDADFKIRIDCEFGELPWAEHHFRYPSSRSQLSDEQRAIVGGAEPEAVAVGWHVYVKSASPFHQMFTWGGKPDQGFGGARRTIKVICGKCNGVGGKDVDLCPHCEGRGEWEQEVIGGWNAGAGVGRHAGLELVSTTVHDTRYSVGMATFIETKALSELVARYLPEVVYDGTEPPRWWGQPSKREWRAMERERIATERLIWEADHGVSFDYLRDERLWPSIRPYSSLGPAPINEYGYVTDRRFRIAVGVPRDEITDTVVQAEG
jgi:hypothetical protein